MAASRARRRVTSGPNPPSSPFGRAAAITFSSMKSSTAFVSVSRATASSFACFSALAAKRAFSFAFLSRSAATRASRFAFPSASRSRRPSPNSGKTSGNLARRTMRRKTYDLPVPAGAVHHLSFIFRFPLSLPPRHEPADPFTTHVNVVDILVFRDACSMWIERTVDLQPMFCGKGAQVRFAVGDGVGPLHLFVKGPHAICRGWKWRHQHQLNLCSRLLEVGHPGVEQSAAARKEGCSI